MALTKHADQEKRLVARAPADIHRRIQEAAELQGATVSQFLLEAALARADEVTERVTRIEASREAFDRMMTALDQPARSLPRLQRAADRYKETVDATDSQGATEPGA